MTNHDKNPEQHPLARTDARTDALGADDYDAACARRERQPELDAVRAEVARLTAGHTVLELACGTGYWTAVMAAGAARIVAADPSQAMLARARGRGLAADTVSFVQADGIDLPQDLGAFSAVFIGFWWSQLARDEQEPFLKGLRARVGKDVLLILLDENYVEGSSPTIARTDARGNTFHLLNIAGGGRIELPKSYPTDSTLRKRMAGAVREIRIARWEYFWLLSCRLK